MSKVLLYIIIGYRVQDSTTIIVGLQVHGNVVKCGSNHPFSFYPIGLGVVKL